MNAADGFDFIFIDYANELLAVCGDSGFNRAQMRKTNEK